jgi:polysaccharide chain length determinant protein (PEP-CTERM system associated)
MSAQMNQKVIQQLKEFIDELLVERRTVVFMFVAVLLASAVLGLWAHKNGSYVSATTIFVEEQKIISPLTEGMAATANVKDQGGIAKELIFGQRIMSQLVAVSGLGKDAVSAVERENVMLGIQRRMKIVNISSNLIRIEYKDADPKRAQAVAQLAAKLFVSEGTDNRIEESREAFQFIEAQSGEYLEKLTEAEGRLKEFRSENIDARVGTEAEVGARITKLQEDIDTTRTTLADANVRRDSLEKQLSGEEEIAVVASREGQYRERIAQLQNQIDELRLNYLDTHPEIVRLKYQIEDLTGAIKEAHENRGKPGYGGSQSATITSPMYLQLRTELLRVKTEIDSLAGRLSEYKRQLGTELDRGRRVNVGEAELAAITRDYEINREIYHDLLRRRENARVSMNLGKTEQGPAFRIQEPANLPVQRTGFRLSSVLLAGIFLSLAIPVSFVFAKLTLDPRVRSAALITSQLKLPLLATVPQNLGAADIVALRREMSSLAALAIFGAAIYVLLGTLRLAGII